MKNLDTSNPSDESPAPQKRTHRGKSHHRYTPMTNINGMPLLSPEDEAKIDRVVQDLKDRGGFF